MNGLFCGLATLDIIQLVTSMPRSNEKVLSKAQAVASGGGAANAAVAFSHIYPKMNGYEKMSSVDNATLVTRIAEDPIGKMIRFDLSQRGIDVIDIGKDPNMVSTMSSILVIEKTGERSVCSMSDFGRQGISEEESNEIDKIDVSEFDVFEMDGYETELSIKLASKCKTNGILTILDGGSVKHYTPSLLKYTDVAIVSEDFAMAFESDADCFDYLLDFGVSAAAITRGEKPIKYASKTFSGEVQPPKVQTVDTLGAGDFFHGALAKALPGSIDIGIPELNEESFVTALKAASIVSAKSVSSFGSRSWLSDDPDKFIELANQLQ